MNPIEIEEQLSKLAAEPFDAVDFPFQFLECYGRKAGEIKSLKKGKSNKSDLGGVLQRNNVHILVSEAGGLEDALTALRGCNATTKNKAHFILATDGENIAAENLKTGDLLACDYDKLGEEFTFFLPLAGIYFTAEIKNQDIDVKATARLNKLYMELLKENLDWSTAERRHDLNQFMARLIFCFFAEDTDIFIGADLFTTTLKQMSDSRSGNVTEIIAALFQAMDTAIEDRDVEIIRPWANVFPYVNGGLFGGNQDVPKFSRIARSYLIAAGELNWSKINPDIFGSMIQAVADDDERGSLGMHYTSVPNILKVLNPLFLDDLREQLGTAGDNARKLLNLRKRIANTRVFDPACGSGNFLVIAYKELRKIEAEILNRRGDRNRNTVINLENFYGIEIKDFAAQIAQIALLIAEFQCDVLYIDQVQACKNMLPLDKANNVVIGNALRLDWLEVCPPTAPVDIVKETDDDLFATPLEQTEINLDEENLGGETYICGNPPYQGKNSQSQEQKVELEKLFAPYTKQWKSLDYVTGWLAKAAAYLEQTRSACAFVTTSSICQGQQVGIIWPIIYDYKCEISFAYKPFQWRNLAKSNAGVTVVVLGLTASIKTRKYIFDVGEKQELVVKECKNINPYLIDYQNVIVESARDAISFSPNITDGNGALDGGHLVLSSEEAQQILASDKNASKFIFEYTGSRELINGLLRYCIWIDNANLDEALTHSELRKRVTAVQGFRKSAGTRARTALDRPHKFAWINKPKNTQLAIPTIFSSTREYITVFNLDADMIVSNSASIVHEAKLDTLSILSSKLHMVWVKAVAGRLREDLRYTSSTCYNTFR